MPECTSPNGHNQAQYLTGTLTYHNLMTYITAGTTICSCIICACIAVAHTFRYTEPRTQKQILRIVWTPAIFAIFSFFGVWHYNLANYLTPIAELYECFALIAAFFLLIALVGPASFESQLEYFAIHPASGRTSDTPDLRWFKNAWITVLQVLPTRVVTLVVTEVVEATHCHGTKSYHRAHTIISVVQGFLTVIAIIGIIKFYMRFRSQIHASDPHIMSKLLVFKLTVGVQLLQRIILNALSQHGVFKPTAYLSYDDLNLGLNSLLTCFEVFIFSILYVWPFWPRGKSSTTGSKIPVMTAALDAVNLTDIVAGVFRAIRLYQGAYTISESGMQQTWSIDEAHGSRHGQLRAHEVKAMSIADD